MFFRGSPWLWLYIRTSIILGGINSPELHEKNHCYQLNRFHRSFEKAENHCRAQGGRLAHVWNKKVQDHLRDFLEEGKKWWVGKNSKPGNRMENNHPTDVPAPLAYPIACLYLSRTFHQISFKEDMCSLEHYFICQADIFPDQDASHERSESNFLSHQRPKKTKIEVAMSRNNVTSGGVPLSTTRHRPALAGPRSSRKASSKFIGEFLKPWGNRVQPPPVTAERNRTAAVTHAGESAAEITSSPKEASHQTVFTTHLQTSFQNASTQVNMEN
ncbi:polycystic kidney disease protein 1-like 3 isoform X1 [Otolemur garnettii]|uniref:polycystic kidney disease protein 1-like 3 isoform X1 n=1 Tax=Otolemur garnettii TaxID=30611 RepID=UPI000C7E9386|nr:polycystic kidney disease protein 1-like 3 isoform X1 [Otolemur garnettii]